MPDNPQHAASRWFRLSDHRVIALEGRDATAFAQAQTMNDVAALQDGHWHWNGWLTAKGRVIALFALIRIDPQTLWLLVPDADAGALAERLRRFVFRSKLTISVREDLCVAGRMRASDLASGGHWAGDPATAIELDLGSAPESGRSLRIATAPAAIADTGEEAEALARWRRADLEHGWPRLDAAQSEQWTPQQLSLDRLRAFSVKKGCYPGQEIVARTHFLGQAKRGLALLQGASGLAAGDRLEAGGTELGTVIAHCDDVALAVVSLEARGDKDAAPAGVAWRFAPLRDGLAR